MATALQTYRASSVAAEKTLFFLNVLLDPYKAEGAENKKEFHMAFLRQDASSIDTGVETEAVSDVTQSTQPEEVMSYKPTMSFSGLFLAEDPVCKFIEKVWRDRATGEECHTDLLEVDTWRNEGNDSSPAYCAYLTDVAVSVSSITNEAGGKRRIEGTFSYASDPVKGTATFDGDTGVATFTQPQG